MDNQKGIDYLKNKICNRLKEVETEMGKHRYKLYMAMVDECDDFEELKEMAEIDLQMDLFEYIKNEITPRLNELNMSLDEIRNIDCIAKMPTIKEHDFDLQNDDIMDNIDDPEVNAALAMLINNRIKTEPIEEQSRRSEDELGQSDALDESSIDEIQVDDFEGELSEEPKNSESSDDEFDITDEDLEYIDDNTKEKSSGSDDEFDISDEDLGSICTDDEANNKSSTDNEFEISDEDLGSICEESEEPKKNDDEFDIDTDELGEFLTDDDKTKKVIMTEDEIFPETSAHKENGSIPDELKMSEDEIFNADVDAIEVSEEDLEYFDSESSDKKKDKTDDEFDILDEDLGSLCEEESTDNTDKKTDEEFEISDEDLAYMDDDKTKESDEKQTNYGDEFDISDEDLGSMCDEDSDEKPKDTGDEFDISDEDLGSMCDDNTTDSETKEVDDMFGDINDDEFGSLLEDEVTENKKSNRNSIDGDIFELDMSDFGVLDDSDKFFNDSSQNKFIKKPDNAITHGNAGAQRVVNKPSEVRKDSIFLNGTENGMKTQKMFNMFCKIENKSTKAFNNIKSETKKASKSKFFDISQDGDKEIDF